VPSTRPEGYAGPVSARVRGVRVHEGKLEATGMRFGIVVSRFNDVVSTPLLEGAVEALESHGASADDLVIAWVPGAFETPIAAREIAEHGGVDAVVCLGAVIRGDTAHFDYVAGEAARGIASVHATTGVPATFGVLTVDTLEQAMDRAGGKHGNKGAEAAMAAVEMVTLLRALRAPAASDRRAVS
jgi:6,7-dimethyl-8-ribityllumazine synthase